MLVDDSCGVAIGGAGLGIGPDAQLGCDKAPAGVPLVNGTRQSLRELVDQLFL